MELIDCNEFFDEFPNLSLTDANHFNSDVFLVTKRSIQKWLLLRGYRDSNSVFKAYLPCRIPGDLTSIHLVLWYSNYYRFPNVPWHAALEDSPAKFRQVYLRYQDTPNHTVTFDIDDSGIIENGFTHSHGDLRNLIGKTFSPTNANSSCIKTYSEQHGNGCFQLIFGQCMGLDWVHLDDIGIGEDALIVRGPGWSLAMADEPSEFDDDSIGRLWICHLHHPKSTWVVRIYRVAWERSKVRLRMEVFRDSSFQNGLDEWKEYDIDVSDFLVHMDYYHDYAQKIGDPSQDPRGLILNYAPCKYEISMEVDGGSQVKISLASKGTKVSMHAVHCTQGNLLSEPGSLISKADFTPRQKIVTGGDIVDNTDSSLPNNPAFNLFLASLAPRLSNLYLVIRVVQCRGESCA